MMTQISTVAAPATSDTIGGPETKIPYLDPDIAALFAEVDVILCAALAPAPSLGPGRLVGRGVHWFAHGVDQRTPSAPSNAVLRPEKNPRPRVNNPVKGR